MEEYEHNPLVSRFFIGRESELEWLRNNIDKRRYSMTPVFISGEAGVGKTALVNNYLFLSTGRERNKNLWLNFKRTQNPQVLLDQFLKKLYEEIPREGFIVVIDGSDFLSDEQISHVIHRIYNIKATRGLIFIGREKRKIERCENLELRIISGLLYDISNGIALPETEIIQSVKPEIISATDYMIECLKKEPQSIFNLTPRNFEELLADLLVDMGWEVELTPLSNDGGKDILAYLDTDLGKMLCLVEAKRYRQDRKVGVDLIRSLYGTLFDHKASSAMLVTTSSFTSGAKGFQEKYEYQLALRDYGDIVRWIQNYKGAGRTI